VTQLSFPESGPDLPIIVHADESCLGNQNAGASKGGAGAIVEFPSDGEIMRLDWFHCSPDTTNNRMALVGATEILSLVKDKFPNGEVLYYSDSQYLVLGITQWVHSWKKRGWKRKGGSVENLEMWQNLLPLSTELSVRWQWVRGHAGHVKNEYADFLATGAAERQTSSGGLTESDFDGWLRENQRKGSFLKFDPDGDFHQQVNDYLHTA